MIIILKQFLNLSEIYCKWPIRAKINCQLQAGYEFDIIDQLESKDQT